MCCIDPSICKSDISAIYHSKQRPSKTFWVEATGIPILELVIEVVVIIKTHILTQKNVTDKIDDFL